MPRPDPRTRGPILALALALALAGAPAALAPAAGPAATPQSDSGAVVLLDLNYTLVANQAETARLGGADFGRRLAYERYREWLHDFLRGRRVILITARPARYREATLARIDSLLGWRPGEAYFNEHDLPPALCKQEVLLRAIFPRHGRPADGARYVAIESNPRTAVMYAGYGIPALRVWDEWQYGDSAKVVR
jgi:hypothetical protein